MLKAMTKEVQKTAQKFDSISHFLQTEEFQYRVFEMGRKVCEISTTQFQHIESQQELYPYPFQQKASFALLFWPETKENEAVIWFLQFPIDEFGYLKQSSRDAFLIDLLEQAGKNIQAKQTGETPQDQLAESPFAFKPREDRLAMFHALATVTLGQQPSKHYQYAHDYLLDKSEGGPGFEQWHFLGLQGIADVVARLNSDNNEALLSQATNTMPDIPLQSYAKALENIRFGEGLFSALLLRIGQELQKSTVNMGLIAGLIRAISSFPPNQKKMDLLVKVLDSNLALEIEVLASISGRCWNDLKDETLLRLFVEKLALQEMMGFNAILADLIMMPGLREPILDVMRNEQRSAELAKKFGEFMKTIAS